MSEPGFEVARAFVTVSPDASDFAAALDEEVGGLALSVVVTPNAADFAAAMDEALGGLSVSVAVTPDASNFAASLDEQVGGLSVSVAVTPDAAGFEASLLEQAGGITVPVTVTAEAAGAAGLGDSVTEQAGTIALPVTPVPEAAGFEDALGERLGDLSVPVQVYPGTSADDFQSQLDDRVGTPVVGVDLQATVANMAEHLADSLAGAIPVPVVPDVSDFADAVAQETAGLTVTAQVIPDTSGDSLSLPVTPDMTDFDGAVQEGAGGLTATVEVIPSPESLDALPARVEEGAGDITVPVTVTPVVPADFGEQVSAQAGSQGAGVALSTGETADGLASVTQAEESAAAGASGLSAAYSALQEQFSALDSELDYQNARFGALSGGIASASDASTAAAGVLDTLNSQFAAVGAEVESAGAELAGLGGDASGASDQLGLVSSMLGELQAGLTAADDAVSAFRDGMSTSMSGAAGAEQEAAAEASGLAAAYSAVQEQFAAMGSELDYVTGRFTALSPGIAAASGETDVLSGTLNSLQAQFAAAGEYIGAFGSETDQAGAAITETAGEVGLLSGMLTELQGSLTAADDSVTSWVASSAAARDAAGGAASGVDVLASSAGGLTDAAPAAGEAASDLSGHLGSLADRLSYMATDPFMWMMTAPLVIGGVSAAIKALSDNSMGLVTELSAADDATGYNTAGYEKLSSQLGQTAQNLDATDKSFVSSYASASRFGASMTGASEAVSALSQASAQYNDIAVNQVAGLTALSDTYGVTRTQAELLATAAGVTYKEMGGVGESAQKAVAAVEAYGTANETASTAVAQLTQDQEVFSSSAFTAKSRISDMDDAFTTLAGNFVGVQTAQLNVTGGFDGLVAASQAAGASMKGTNTQSVGLQQSFYAQAGAIEQAANAMLQNGDSAQTVTGYINTQITALSKYEGGSKTATTAVQDLKKWEDSLTGSLQTQGSYLSTTLTNDLDNAILKYSGTQTAVNNYANALVDFGKNSPQAKNAQDLLTESIVKGGLAAGQSTGQIAQMISTMEKIPLKEAIQIVLNAEGQYSVTGAVAPVAVNGGLTNVPGTNLGPVPGHAGGGLVTGGSRSPRADDIPALLSHGEYVVNAAAASKYGTGFLDSVNAGHFASGGSVSGSYSGDAAGLGSFLAGNYNSTNTMLIQAVENAMAGAIASAQASGGSARAPVIVNFNGTQYPTAEQQQALMTQLSALVGVS